MPLDRLAFAAPARTKVLVVPIGGSSGFSARYDRIRQISDIRLLDIAPIPEARQFNPQTFPQGRIFFLFDTRAEDDDTAFLHDFEPFRKTMVVLGVGGYMAAEEAAIETERLAQSYPTAIVHNCVFFGAPDNQSEASRGENESEGSRPTNHNHPSSFTVSAAAERLVTGVETVMCGVARNYLAALDAYALLYHQITLRLPVSMDGHVLTRTITLAQKRLSSGAGTLLFTFAPQTQLLPAAESKMRALQKHAGRHAKVMAQFFLLGGRCSDALHYFTDAAVNCKKADDHLWLASALEGLAVAALVLLFLGLPPLAHNPMLLAVLHVPKSRFAALALRRSTDTLPRTSSSRPSSAPRTSSAPRPSLSAAASPRASSSSLSFGAAPVTDLSQLPVTELLRLLCSKASQYYQLSTLELEDCVPDLVYVESLLRTIKFLVALHLGPPDRPAVVLDYLLKGTPLDPHLRLDAVSKQEIVLEIDKLFLLQLVDLEFAEQCRVYCALASIYADLRLYRKQAFILRIFLVLLLPKLSHLDQHAVVAESTAVSTIRDILEILFLVYRINSDPEVSRLLAKLHASDWITLQLQLLKICLRIAEALQDFELLAKLCILIFARFSHCLPAQDQLKMKEKLNWLTLLFQEDSKSIFVPHPDPFLVRDAKFVLASTGSSLQPFKEKAANAPSAQTGPFIFDPYSSKTKQSAEASPVLCVNEIHQMKITFQNPFKFEVSLSEIELVTDNNVKVETLKHLARSVVSNPLSGKGEHARNGWTNTLASSKVSTVSMDQFQGQSKSVVLLPTSSTQVLVSFKTLNAGSLVVKGFNIRVGASRSQFFHIVESENFSGLQKTKFTGITVSNERDLTLDKLLDNLTSGDIGDRVTTKNIQLNVIPPQPCLSVTRNLVTNGWIMLLEGEKKTFTLQLRNTSDETIDYLSFSFWDSCSDAINAKLAQNGANSVEDTYELEWSLLKKKPFTVVNKQEIASKYKHIQPGGDLKIDYEVLGKKGILELKLILEYAHKETDGSSISYMKNVTIPLDVSVEPSLEITGCEVLPFFSSSLSGYSSHENGISQDAVDRNMESLLRFFTEIKASEDDDISNYCLLVLDVRNLWKQRLMAKIGNKGTHYTVNEALDSMQTIRILLPIRCLEYDLVDVTKSVPSLRNKQFIKNYNVTEEQEREIRRKFWIRSALLENLAGEWHTVGQKHGRSGEIDMRHIRLTTQMTNSLVFDRIQIQHSIFVADGTQGAVERSGEEYQLQREQFYTLKTRIINHTQQTLGGILRHVPFPVNASTKQDLLIDQKILYNGVLQKHVGKDAIPAGTSHEVSLGFMILEKGRYEWGSMFDIDGSGSRVVGRDPMYMMAV